MKYYKKKCHSFLNRKIRKLGRATPIILRLLICKNIICYNGLVILIGNNKLEKKILVLTLPIFRGKTIPAHAYQTSPLKQFLDKINSGV